MSTSRTTTTAAGYKTKTLTIKNVKAKHVANQAGLDRLQELMLKATSGGNQNYTMTIRRALKSLQECTRPILTQQEALQLKFVGPAMAKKICPNTTGIVATAKPKTKIAAKRKRNETATATATNNDERCPPRPIRTRVCPKHAMLSVLSNASSSRSAKEASYWAAKLRAETLELGRGPWKIVLLVDIREHRSKQVVSSCKQAGIPCEERQLAIGDMAWVARCTRTCPSNKNETIEILVGTIVERKEVSDLAASLFGTRYAEQRLRLFQCGIPQTIFLVEGNLSSLPNCPSDTLQMAMMETRLNLGFKVIHTQTLAETVGVLKTLHSRIVQRTFPAAFDSQALPSFGGGGRNKNRRRSSLLELVFDTPPVPPFGRGRFLTYEELKAKVELDRELGTKSVKALTLAMLKQIPTLSQKKCTAIAEEYPTLNTLLKNLSYTSSSSSSQPLRSISTEGRQLGPTSETAIRAACCTLGDGSIAGSGNPAVHKSGKAGIATTKPPVAEFLPLPTITAIGRCNDNSQIQNLDDVPLSPDAKSSSPTRPLDARSSPPETVDLLTPESSSLGRAPNPIGTADGSSIAAPGATNGSPIIGKRAATTAFANHNRSSWSFSDDDDDDEFCIPRTTRTTTATSGASKRLSSASSSRFSEDGGSSSCLYSSPDTSLSTPSNRNENGVLNLLDDDDDDDDSHKPYSCSDTEKRSAANPRNGFAVETSASESFSSSRSPETYIPKGHRNQEVIEIDDDSD